MNLAYRTWGVRENPPLVLLHGFLGAANDWEILASKLEASFYMVAVDLPGHGNSQSIDLACFKKDPVSNIGVLLDDIMDQLDLGQFGILGYSLGARIAMGYALSRSQRVSCLIIESGHPGLKSEEEKKARWQSDQVWTRRFLSEPLEQVLDAWYQQSVFSDLSDSCRKVLIGKRIHQKVSLITEMFESFSLSRQQDYSCALAEADFPVHYLYGEKDKKYKTVGAQLGEGGSLTTLNGVRLAGHNIHWEQPESMAAVIQTLYGSNGAGHE